MERRYRAIAAIDGRVLRVVCVEGSDEIRMIMLDYDKDGRIVGLEVLGARAHLPKDLLSQAA